MTLGAGFRVCLRGADADSGGRCGLSTLSVNYAVSNAYVDFGAALNLQTYLFVGRLLPLRDYRVNPRPMAIHTH